MAGFDEIMTMIDADLAERKVYLLTREVENLCLLLYDMTKQRDELREKLDEAENSLRQVGRPIATWVSLTETEHRVLCNLVRNHHFVHAIKAVRDLAINQGRDAGLKITKDWCDAWFPPTRFHEDGSVAERHIPTYEEMLKAGFDPKNNIPF